MALDDYFLDRDRTPFDEHGERDFESLAALDVPLINEHLLGLMRGDDGGAAAVLVPHRHARSQAAPSPWARATS